MCDPVPEIKCRAKQLFAASENVMDFARIVGGLKVAQDFSTLAKIEAHLQILQDKVAVFDRLNRGL